MAGLKFRVLLDSQDKTEVFRDILIADSDNFESFYRAIVDAYQFSQEQMASFYVSNNQWDKGHEIALFDMSFGDDADQEIPDVMSTSLMRDYVESKDQKFILVHDFMRMWIFLIELIEYQEATPAKPTVKLSVGNAPSETSRTSDELQFETEPSEFDDEEDEDAFGFNDFEDSYDEYDY